MKTELVQTLAGSDRFVGVGKTITQAANSNRFPDAGEMFMRDLFFGSNKMVGSGPSSAGSLCLRANGAATRQPRATPWELVHPDNHQP